MTSREAEIHDWLQAWIAKRHFDEIDSTQSYVEREHASFEQDKLTVVSADFQSSGRGTGDRQWHAGQGLSVLASFFFRFPSECETSFVNRNVANTTKVASVAALKALQCAAEKEGRAIDKTGSPLEFGLKWPNDIVVNGRKIGGVLAKGLPNGCRLDMVIIGVGLNINTPSDVLDTIHRPVWPATSLHAVTGGDCIFDVAAIRDNFVLCFAAELRRFFVGGFPAFREHVNRLDVLMGSKVLFRVRESVELKAIFEGVDDDGLILLRDDSGDVKAYPSGEIIARVQDD